MSTKQRESSQRAVTRARLPSAERETLLPCPACEGQGKHLLDGPDGRYSMKRCRWCNGAGFVDHTMFRVFARWLRIYNRNRLSPDSPCRRGG
jgi:hypothetical protein